MSIRGQIMVWDWKEQPDLDQLAQVIEDVSMGQLKLYAIDTGSDQMAVAVSNAPMSPVMVKAAYDRYVESGAYGWLYQEPND